MDPDVARGVSECSRGADLECGLLSAMLVLPR
jgi:hypothetical protein